VPAAAINPVTIADQGGLEMIGQVGEWLVFSDQHQQLPPVPNGYDHGGYQKSFIGTGKFKMTSYTPNVGATFAWNPHYWGTPALPARTERRIAGQIEQLLLDETPIITRISATT
jgi:ABC-type transport system substrate-binding protein